MNSIQNNKRYLLIAISSCLIMVKLCKVTSVHCAFHEALAKHFLRNQKAKIDLIMQFHCLPGSIVLIKRNSNSTGDNQTKLVA